MANTLILNNIVMTKNSFMFLAPNSKFQESSKLLRRRQQSCLAMSTEIEDSHDNTKYLEITHENVDDVRPFLDLADGTIDCVDIISRTGDGFPPCIKLLIMGKVVMLEGIKESIVEKIKSHFMIPGLRIEYERGDYDEFVDQVYA